MGLAKLTVRIVIALSLIIGLISLYLLFYFTSPQKPLAGTGGIQKIDSIGGDFELIDQNGKIFTERNLKGSLSLIYFGFTYCPDICPYSLDKITAVMETLEKYGIEAKPIFITIDPDRDSVTMLNLYLKNFHPNFIGLTGSHEQVKKAAEKFKVYYAKAHNGEKKLDYMIDHSSFIYIMDKNGDCIKIFGGSSREEDIIEFIRLNKNR